MSFWGRLVRVSSFTPSSRFFRQRSAPERQRLSPAKNVANKDRRGSYVVVEGARKINDKIRDDVRAYVACRKRVWSEFSSLSWMFNGGRFSSLRNFEGSYEFYPHSKFNSIVVSILPERKKGWIIPDLSDQQYHELMGRDGLPGLLEKHQALCSVSSSMREALYSWPTEQAAKKAADKVTASLEGIADTIVVPVAEDCSEVAVTSSEQSEISDLISEAINLGTQVQEDIFKEIIALLPERKAPKKPVNPFKGDVLDYGWAGNGDILSRYDEDDQSFKAWQKFLVSLEETGVSDFYQKSDGSISVTPRSGARERLEGLSELQRDRLMGHDGQPGLLKDAQSISRLLKNLDEDRRQFSPSRSAQVKLTLGCIKGIGSRVKHLADLARRNKHPIWYKFLDLLSRFEAFVSRVIGSSDYAEQTAAVPNRSGFFGTTPKAPSQNTPPTSTQPPVSPPASPA